MAKNDIDDFGFDSGDELFPLDDDIFSTKEKPPKGVKGYLKNVVKSVGRLGIKIGETYMPEVNSLISSLKPEMDLESGDAKEVIGKAKMFVKKHAKKAKDEVVNTAKETVEKTKEAIQTGSFFKEDDMDFSSFGGFGDDGDGGDSYDYGGEYDSGSSGDEQQFDFVKSSKLSLKATKTSAQMTTRATLMASKQQTGAIIGATQTQISSNRMMFSEQMMIDAEHHHQKMSVMKNIARNLTKVIQQNNLNLKATMEYSTKSLAFTQDLSAMMKEIRDSQWKLSGYQEDKERSDNRTSFDKSFGSGFDINHFVKDAMTKVGDATGLTMIKDMMSMGQSFGLSPTKLIKDMIGDSIFKGVTSRILGNDVKKTMVQLDKQAKGLPTAINSWLGMKGEHGFGIKNDFINNALSKAAGFLHVDDTVKSYSGKFAMGDPDKVHPFDNKAHKVLTEVIPMTLSEISAGVNNKEQTYFDFISNNFKTVSSLNRRIESERESVYDYSEGFSEAMKYTNQKAVNRIDKSKNKGEFADSTGKTDASKIEKINRQIMKNLFDSATGLRDEELAEMLEDGTYLNGRLKRGLNSLSEASEKQRAVEMFVYGLMEERKTDPDAYREIQQSINMHSLRMSSTNMELEESISTGGSSILFSTIAQDDQIKKDIKRLEKKMAIIKDSTMTPKMKKEKMDKYISEIKNLKMNSQGTPEGSNFINTDDLSEDNTEGMGSVSKWEIKDLKKTDTNSMVKNIYNLLLDGIITYPQDKMSKGTQARFKARRNIFKQDIEMKKTIEQHSKEEEEREKEAFTTAAKEKLEASYDYRIEELMTPDFEKKLNRVPIIGPMLKGMNSLFGKILNPISEKLDDEFYGISKKQSERAAAKKDEKIAEYRSVHGDKYTKENEILDSINTRGVVKTAKKYLKEAKESLGASLESIKVGDTNLAQALSKLKNPELKAKLKAEKNVINKAKIILAEGGETFNKFKDQLNDIIEKNEKASSIKSTVSKTYYEARDTFKSEGFLKGSKTISKKAIASVNKVLDAKLGNIKIPNQDKTLSQLLAEINDGELIQKLKAEKNIIEKAKIILNTTNDKLEPVKVEIRKFLSEHEKINKVVTTVDKHTKSAVKFTKTKIKEATNLLGNTLGNIKIPNQDKTLSQLLAEINDGELIQKLKAEKNVINKAKIILGATNEKLEPVKEEIRKFLAKHEKVNKITSSIDKHVKASVSKAYHEARDTFKSEGFIKGSKSIIKKASENVNKVLGDKLGSIKIPNQNKTLADLMTEINDTELMQKLKAEKNVINKAKIILGATNEKLEPVKEEIRKFLAKHEKVNKITSSIDKHVKASVKFVKNKSNDLMNFVGSKMGGELGKIKVPDGDKTLAEILVDINDVEFLKEIMQENTVSGKAKVILNSNYNELEPIKGELRKFIEKHEKHDKIANNISSGLKGIKGAIVAGGITGGAKHIVDKIKDKYKDLSEQRQEGTLHDQVMDKKEAHDAEMMESQTESLATMAKAVVDMSKGGVKLDRETTDKLEDIQENSTSKLGDKIGGMANGFKNKVSDFIDSTGLGNTKVGGAVKGVASAVSGIGTAATSVAKVAGKLGIGAGKLGGKAALTGIKLGGKAALTTASVGGKAVGLAGHLASGTVKVAGKAGGFLGKALGVIKNLITGFFKNPKISAITGRSLVGKVTNGIAKGIGKIAGKITGKLMAMSAAGATVVVTLGLMAAGFLKGMASAKQTFNMGVGTKPTAGMRIACGIATALDAGLMGIPGLICKFLGFKNAAEWFYGLIGSEAEKESIAKYQRYNAMRAKIFGIDEPNALVAFENRNNLASRSGRNVLSVLTLGLAKSNDEKDAKVLGFKSAKVFEYWKEKKYDPLNELRKEVAEEFGGLKKVESMNIVGTTDSDGDGEISESEEQKHAEEVESMQNQQLFRAEYLKRARDYVLKNKLAWLGSFTSLEEFAERTGTSVDKVKNKSFIKKLGTAALTAAIPVTAIARLFTPKARENIKSGVKAIGKGVAVVGKGIASVATKVGKGIAGAAVKVGKGIASAAVAFGSNIANNFRQGVAKIADDITELKEKINKILNSIKKAFTNPKLKSIKNLKLGLSAITKVVQTLFKYVKENDNAKKNMVASIGMSILKIANPLILIGVFMKAWANPTKILNVEASKDQITPSMKLAAAITGLLTFVLKDSDNACRSIHNKTLARFIYEEIVVKGTDLEDEKYHHSRAKVYGVERKEFAEFEKRNDVGKNILKGTITILKNVMGGGADGYNAGVLKFNSIEVYKFWKEKKYDPLKKLEENIAMEFGDIDDLKSVDCKDPELQAKFRAAFLKAAENYVKSNNLEWLTNKTTYKELVLQKKSGKIASAVDNDSTKQTIGAKIKNFFTGGVVDTRGASEQQFGKSRITNPNENFAKMDTEDSIFIAEHIKKMHKYSDKTTNIISSASQSIKGFWKSIRPDFYEAPSNSRSMVADNSTPGAFYQNGGKGGTESTGEGLSVYNKMYGISKVNNKHKAGISSKPISSIDDANMDSTVSPKALLGAKVKGSVVTSAIDKYNEEICSKLNILQAMHDENLRHNKVSENFFAAALSMLSTMANNMGNRQMSTDIDRLVSMAAR